jgi:hypothetical protein
LYYLPELARQKQLAVEKLLISKNLKGQINP